LVIPRSDPIIIHHATGYRLRCGRLALQADAEAWGASLAFHAPLLSGFCIEQRFELPMGGAEPMTLICRELINCAGQLPGAGRARHAATGITFYRLV
jgi:hypothetical protein